MATFLSLSAAEKLPSYSLVDAAKVPLDYKLISLMNFKNGTFVEVGAHDGITQSNTKLFEECFGWTGVLVEPSASLWPLLLKNRPGSQCFQCALGSFSEHNTYAYGDFDGILMACIGGSRVRKNKTLCKVLVRSLQSILDEAGISHVNFFSLDTEGYELNILKGIDFERVTFDYMLIEVYNAEHAELKELLDGFGYEEVENFSNYNHKVNPDWDGLHNDYLFKRKSL